MPGNVWADVLSFLTPFLDYAFKLARARSQLGGSLGGIRLLAKQFVRIGTCISYRLDPFDPFNLPGGVTLWHVEMTDTKLAPRPGKLKTSFRVESAGSGSQNCKRWPDVGRRCWAEVGADEMVTVGCLESKLSALARDGSYNLSDAAWVPK